MPHLLLAILSVLVALVWATPATAATYDIRCDKISLMATETKPAQDVQEDSVCRGRYDRGQHAWGNVSKVLFHLTDTQGADIPAAMTPDTSQFKYRCRIDGVPVTAWRPWPIAACDLTQPSLGDPSKTIYQSLADGSHGIDLDVDWPNNYVRSTGVLFTSGPPLGWEVPQPLAVCPTALDFAFGAVFSSGCTTVPYPNPEPDIEPWNRVSKAVPYTVFPGTGQDRVTQNNTRLNAYWIESLGEWAHQKIPRNPICSSANRDGREGPCRIHTANIQPYAIEDAYSTSIIDGQGTSNPITPMIDGPRGIGTIAKVVDAHWCAGNIYMGESTGRISWLQGRGPGTGRILTAAGNRQTPGHPYGYWKENQSPQFNSHLEFHGTWVAGHTGPTTFNELWGKVILDLASCNAGTGAHHFLIMDSKNNRLVYANHLPAHEPGGRPLLSVAVNFSNNLALCRWPWTGDLRPQGDGWVYVACMMSHTTIRTRPMVPGLYSGTWETELVWDSAKKPTREQIGVVDTACRGCPHRATGMITTQIRAAYHADGPPGVSSQIFPQALRFDSQGKMIVASRYGFALFEHELDPDVTKPLVVNSRQFAAWNAMPEVSADWRDVTIDVNWHGGAGQLDMIRILGWGQGTPFAFTRQGAHLGALWPDAPKKTLATGQMSGAYQLQYPWVAATNKDGEEIYFPSSDPMGIIRRLKLPSDVPVDLALYERGFNTWKGGGGGPSFSLTHGQHGLAPLAPITMDTLGGMADAAICAEFRSGLRTGIPRTLSDADCPAVVYFVRQDSKRVQGAEPPPPPPPTSYPITLVKTGEGTVSGPASAIAVATVNLLATPATGWTFSAWSAPCAPSFPMPASPTTCAATFVQVPPPVVVPDVDLKLGPTIKYRIQGGVVVP